MKQLTKLYRNTYTRKTKEERISKMTDIKVYTTEEALEVLKVTQRTLYRYIKAGQIKAIKLGREYRITEDALKDFLERGTEDNYLDKLQKPHIQRE